LALLSPSSEFGAAELPIEERSDLAIGSQVTTWGFPEGYAGRVPLLSVGYLAGIDAHRASSGKVLQRWVVNAAFNRGNSGGPLLSIETGGIIGVVSSKLAPISPASQSALDALSAQRSGFVYTAKSPDGSTHKMSEGQIVAQILDELRAQVQLVIGMAVVLDDLRQFVEAQGLAF
jgi:S1-C subfamily serine protease